MMTKGLQQFSGEPTDPLEGLTDDLPAENRETGKSGRPAALRSYALVSRHHRETTLQYIFYMSRRSRESMPRCPPLQPVLPDNRVPACYFFLSFFLLHIRQNLTKTTEEKDYYLLLAGGSLGVDSSLLNSSNRNV